MRISNIKSTPKGFSLVEVVIAIGIVAILLTTFFAVFAPAQRNIQRSLGIKDANRMSSALENELAILHDGEASASVATAFDKAFKWIEGSNAKDTTVLVYQYTAVPGESNRAYNAPVPYKVSEGGIPGKDYITVTAVRSLGDEKSRGLAGDELQPGIVTGGVYAVRMTQLIEGDDGLKLGSPGKIVDPEGGTSYEQAYIAFQAEFFRLKSNQATYAIDGGWSFESLGKSVANRNMAIRR